MYHLAPATLDDLLNLIVGDNVSPTKPVYGLLRVTNYEQGTGNGPTPAPIRLMRVIGREEHQDLGLYRIGVWNSSTGCD
jgi:hypothetical protein